MSRYIEADKVLKELRLNHNDVIYIDKRDTAKRIEKIQGIDIVRCKECRWWIVAMDENNSDEDYLKCSMDKWPNADDFCSYGERKATEITTDCSWK